jgi:hypothetical protein
MPAGGCRPSNRFPQFLASGFVFADGIGIQSASLKKNGSANSMQPIVGFSIGPLGICRYFAIRFRMSESDRTPLPSPNASHAREIGKKTKRVKNPPPTIKFLGECSLKSNNSQFTVTKSFKGCLRRWTPEICSLDAGSGRVQKEPIVIGHCDEEVHREICNKTAFR